MVVGTLVIIILAICWIGLNMYSYLESWRLYNFESWLAITTVNAILIFIGVFYLFQLIIDNWNTII